MASSSQRSELSDRSRRFLIIVVAALALLVGAGFAARSAWQHRKSQLANRFADRARESRLRQDWAVAHAQLRAAHDLAPTQPAVLRGLAEFYSTFNNPEAVAYWRQLEDSGSMTPGDRLAYARLALELHRPDLARQCLWPFHRENPGNPDGLLLVSEIFALEGDLPQARAAAVAAAAGGADSQAVELRLATLELNSPQPEEWARAKVRLLTMVMTGSARRAEAAVILLARNLATRAEERLMADLIPQGTNAPFREQTVRLALALRRNSAPVGDLVRDFAAANRLTAPSPELLFAGRTLAQVGEHGAVLELIPEPLALANEGLCRLRLGALAAGGNVAETDRLLAVPGLPLPRRHVAIFQAGAAQVAGRTNELASLWQIALSNCRDDPSALELLAHNAETVGATAAAVQAWEFLLLDPMLASYAAKELTRLGMTVRDPRAIYVALHRMSQLRPEDAEVRLALAYCRLILQVDEEAAAQAVAAGPQAYRSRALYQIVASLGALRRHDAEKAVQALEDPAIDWPNAPISWRVVQAAAFGQAGLFSRARDVGATLNPEELSAQELALVRPWLPERPAP